MRRHILAWAALIAVCGPAVAGEFNYPEDVFSHEFDIVVAQMYPELQAQPPFQVNPRQLLQAFGKGANLILVADSPSSLVQEVSVMTGVPPETDEIKFAALSHALMALLAPSMSSEVRHQTFVELRALAPQHQGTIGKRTADGVLFTYQIYPSGQLAFTATAR